MNTMSTNMSTLSHADTITPVKIKTGFLRPIDERIMLAIPSIGILLCVLQQLYSKFNHGSKLLIDDVYTLFTSLIFMDAVHVTFTFMLLFFLPELKIWSTSALNKPKTGWDKGLKFWTRMILIGSGLGLIVTLLKISDLSTTMRGFATIWLFLELVGPSQHTAAQMRGISFVYNSTIKRAYQYTKEEQLKANVAEKAERTLFKLLIMGDIFYWIPKIFKPDQFYIPGIKFVQILGAILISGSAILLVLNSFRYPKQSETDKTLFLSRVFLFPLKMMNPIAGLMIRATHGTEYLFIFRRIVQSSSISEKKKKKVYLTTAIVSFFYGFLFLSLWSGTLLKLFNFMPGKEIVSIGLLVTFVVRFTHYYMDAVLFKMSDPLTRATIAPLLTPFTDPKMQSSRSI